jgi:hypothetical protein
MTELKDIFDARDEAFAKKTMEIFGIIHTALVCITEFLNETDPSVASGNVSWEDANLMDDLVVIIGMVNYEEGTVIENDGNKITITNDNIEYFQRIVHMSLPYEMVLSSNEEDIMEFLHTMGTNHPIEFTESVDTPPDDSMEFDLSKLTEEQRRSLMFHHMKGKN